MVELVASGLWNKYFLPVSCKFYCFFWSNLDSFMRYYVYISIFFISFWAFSEICQSIVWQLDVKTIRKKTQTIRIVIYVFTFFRAENLSLIDGNNGLQLAINSTRMEVLGGQTSMHTYVQSILLQVSILKS